MAAASKGETTDSKVSAPVRGDAQHEQIQLTVIQHSLVGYASASIQHFLFTLIKLCIIVPKLNIIIKKKN